MAAWADSATVADLSARVTSLTDSTHRLASRLDSIIAAAADTVRDTTWVGLVDRPAQPEVGLPVWVGYAFTAVAAVVAGVIAQSFRVWLDKKLARRFLVNELFADFAVLERMTEVLSNQFEKQRTVATDNLATVDFVLGNFDRLRKDLVLLRFDYRAWVNSFFRELSGTRALLGQALDGKLPKGELYRVEYELKQVVGHFGEYPNIFDRVKEAYDREMWLEIWWETVTEPIRSKLMVWRVSRWARKREQEDSKRTNG